jgi:hypothetical protein
MEVNNIHLQGPSKAYMVNPNDFIIQVFLERSSDTRFGIEAQFEKG